MAQPTTSQSAPTATEPAAALGPLDWDDVPVCIALVDARGRLVRASAELLARVGSTRSELEGNTLASLVGDEVSAMLLGDVDIAATGVGCRLRRKDGEAIDVIAHRRRRGSTREWVITLTADGGAHRALPEARHELSATLKWLHRSRALATRERAARRAIEMALMDGEVAVVEQDIASGTLMWHGAFERVFESAGAPPRTLDAFRALLHPDDAGPALREIERGLRDKDRFHFASRLAATNGGPRWVAGYGACSYDAEGEPFVLTAVFCEETALHRTLASLRDANRKIRSLLESIGDGFVAIDHDGRYAYVNRRAGKMFGRAPETLVGEHVGTELLQSVGEPFQTAYERACDERTPIAIEAYSMPWSRWFDTRIYPLDRGMVIFFTDITERKRAEQELQSAHDQMRALSGRLQVVREEERTRIARAIHDDLGQTMTAVRMDLLWLRRRFSSMPAEPEERAKLEAEAVARLDELRSLSESAIESVQHIASELRPIILDEEGLSSAVRWYADEVAHRSEIHVTLRDETGGVSSSRDADTALFRIFQEALTNVVRHSGASNADAMLARRDGALVLQVDDDGAGFEPSAVADPRALGLLGMRERAAAVGGSVSFERRPDGGTRVIASVPAEAPSDPQLQRS